MLWSLFVVLLLLWLLGVVSSYTLGGLIHLLPVLAVVAVLVQLITGRRAVLESLRAMHATYVWNPRERLPGGR